jgi:GTP-binding protein HflX
VTQKRQSLGAATLLGKGKLRELAAWTGGTGSSQGSSRQDESD